jgi:hypothetical protein
MGFGSKSATESQMQVCKKYGARFDPAALGSKLGIAFNVRESILPLNGLRHFSTEETNGWYIWAGETLLSTDDFFQPMHIEHISNWCPSIVKFLALPAGWRFLVAVEYEDVWFDETLLQQDAKN